MEKIAGPDIRNRNDPITDRQMIMIKHSENIRISSFLDQGEVRFRKNYGSDTVQNFNLLPFTVDKRSVKVSLVSDQQFFRKSPIWLLTCLDDPITDLAGQIRG